MRKKREIIDEFKKDRPDNRADGMVHCVYVITELDKNDKLDLNKLKDVGYQRGKTTTYMQVIAGVYVWHNIVEPRFYK